MICRLCLNDEIDVLNIFDDKGVELQIAATVSKYFWFEPKPDDPISAVICDKCWNKLSDFSHFYKLVEEAHKLLTERFSVKSDTKSTNKKIHVFTECIERKESMESLDAAAAVEDNYEAFFNEVLEDGNSDSIVKIETTANLEDIANLNDIPFGDDNEYTEYLCLDEHDKSEEDTLQISPISDAENEIENIRITRSGSKRNNKLKSINAASKRKKCNARKECETNISCNTIKGQERLAANLVDERTQSKAKSKDKRKCKFRNIDEQISKYLCLKCDICGSKETTFTDLLKHMSLVHNMRGYATCCNKKFYRRSLLFHHSEKHLNPDCLRCQDCNKSFADKQCLRNHMLVKHQPDEAKIFACTCCEKKFARSYLLEQHQKKHEERNHICEACEKGFATASLLNAHIKVIHHNYGTMCEICAKVIRGRSAFQRHVLEHQGVQLPKVQCPKCNAWYKDKHSLQKHIRRHNEEGIVHSCNVCGKVAPNRSALLAHIRYVHKDRAFECGICKKAFKNHIGLKEHMTVHTGETLYNCPYCARAFSSNANMHSHRKKMHPKEFAEARLKRHETKLMCSKDETENNEVIPVNDHHQLVLAADDDETHILITTSNDFVFKVA